MENFIDNDAGKITTREINAKSIKVINLDADSISGNDGSFIKAISKDIKEEKEWTKE